MSAEPARTLEETLQLEKRLCPQCGFEIQNPMTDRCPRCFSTVVRQASGCGSCTWQGNCEFGHLIEEHKKKQS